MLLQNIIGAPIGGQGGRKLWVTLVGDALMEPFWPEGLGINRGFLSCLDSCWMISRIGDDDVGEYTVVVLNFIRDTNNSHFSFIIIFIFLSCFF